MLLTVPAHAQLLHYYPFSIDARDVVGGVNGTLVGGATVSGGMLRLNGSSAYVQFGSHIVPTSGSFTVSLLAQQTVVQTSFVEFISQGSNLGPNAFFIGLDPTRNIRAGQNWIATAVPFPAVGNSVFVTLVADASINQSMLYLNGNLAATRNFAIVGGANGQDTRLGQQFDCCPEFFGGNLDEVRIYGNALSAAEVATLVAPEPSTYVLLASGLIVVGGIAVRRKQRVS